MVAGQGNIYIGKLSVRRDDDDDDDHDGGGDAVIQEQFFFKASECSCSNRGRSLGFRPP